MNYFELYDLPLSLKVDTTYNLKKYYALSRQYHPDQFSMSSPEEQEHALHTSTLINAAKQTLDNSYLRLAYILKEEKILEEEEKFSLPPDFLASMMDINEQIMALKFEPDAAQQVALENHIKQLEEELYKPVAYLFQADVFQGSPEIYQQLKLYYYKMKYLKRIQENLAGHHPEL
ncbi:MAG: hypothetical protein JNM95_07365 [Chitinophagaceae bacterium]|nr:hypothetical protein [Chitinophagaceae bacterium]